MQVVLHLPVAERVQFFPHYVILSSFPGVCWCFDKTQSGHLDADAALQLELQTDHVHIAGGAQLVDLCYFIAHLVDGHLDGAQIGVVLVHHRDTLLHIRKTVCCCRKQTKRLH